MASPFLSPKVFSDFQIFFVIIQRVFPVARQVVIGPKVVVPDRDHAAVADALVAFDALLAVGDRLVQVAHHSADRSHEDIKRDQAGLVVLGFVQFLSVQEDRQRFPARAAPI